MEFTVSSLKKAYIMAPLVLFGCGSQDQPEAPRNNVSQTPAYVSAVDDSAQQLRWRAGDVRAAANIQSEFFPGDKLEKKVSDVYRACYPGASLDDIRPVVDSVASYNGILNPNRILPGTIIDYELITGPCLRDITRELKALKPRLLP